MSRRAHLRLVPVGDGSAGDGLVAVVPEREESPLQAVLGEVVDALI